MALDVNSRLFISVYPIKTGSAGLTSTLSTPNKCKYYIPLDSNKSKAPLYNSAWYTAPFPEGDKAILSF